MMGVSREITEQKEAERTLALQGRLNSLRAEIGEILSGEGSIREILQRAAESLNEYLGVAFYRIWSLNGAENTLELQASAGLYTHIDGDHGRVPVGKLKIGLIAEERRAHITNDVLEDPRIGDKEWARREGMVAFAGLPLIVEGALVGVMATFSREPIPDSVIQDLVPIAESLAQFISRRRAEEDLRHSEERFRQLAEHIDEVFWMTSADGREIIYVNPAYEEIWGTSRQSLYENATDWADAIHPEDRDRAEGAFFERASTGVFDEEYRIVRPDGTIRWIWDRGFPVKDEAGNIYRIAGIAEDITDRVQVMERLREARDGAESASKAKSDFLAMMSHEIRNPMTTIIGMTELALSSDLTPKQADYLGAVADSSYSLLELLNEILDLSRIESGKLELDPQPFSLHQNLEIAIAGLKERACSKGLSFSCTISDDVPDGLVGDAGRLRQVVLNLADNAIKFTEQGEVTIEVELKSQDEEAIVLNFIVTDTGIGINPNFQKQIFESFTQVETFLDRARGGAGLGLAIASRLVRLMGGTIHLDSTPGSGSVFSFETRLRRFTGSSNEINEQLAATPSAWSGDLSDHSLSLAAKPLSILLAEDDEMNQLLVSELIQKVGHRVDAVDNGIDVLQRVEEKSYDLLLMDLQMPGLDGIEATRRIRESERGTTRHVPIIALTAHAMESDRRRCIRAGMDAYLSKPIRLREFLDHVDELVGGQSAAAREWKQKPAETGVSTDGAFSIMAALDVVYGDEDLLKDLASKFLQRYDELFIEIRQSIHRRDGEKLHREAHILKSLLANFAAQTPAAAAAHLENCGRRNEWAEADTALIELDQAIEAMTPVLKDFISC